MDEILFSVACLLILISPVLLIIGLIKPALFKKITGKKSRKRAALLAVAVFVAAFALAGIFEPESYKQERAARESAAVSQEKQQVKEVKDEPKAKIKADPVKKITPQVTGIHKAKAGYVIYGYSQPDQLMELQTGGEKYKVTANDDGYFKSETIESFLPYGKIGLYKLEKSFLRTKAIHKQTKYYTLFASKPKLSRDRLPAKVTQVKKDGNGFKLQGFYLADTKLTLWNEDGKLKEFKTNEEGFFVFTGLPNEPEITELSIYAGKATISEKRYVYTPTLRLLRHAPEIKKQTVTQEVPYTSSTVNDSTLTKGQTRIAVAGQKGQKKLTYTLVFIDGKQVQKKLTTQEVTKRPVNEVKKVGTYVKPAPAPSSSSSSGGTGYTNSSGNYVPSPSSNPAGASAQCRDGTYSYSQSRRGTCSHHGGVAVWY